MFAPCENKSATICKADSPVGCQGKKRLSDLLSSDPNTRLFHWVLDGFYFLLVFWMTCMSAWIYFESLKNSSHNLLRFKLQSQRGWFCNKHHLWNHWQRWFFKTRKEIILFWFWLQMESRARWYVWTSVPFATFKCSTSVGRLVAWLKTPWVC